MKNSVRVARFIERNLSRRRGAFYFVGDVVGGMAREDGARAAADIVRADGHHSADSR